MKRTIRIVAEGDAETVDAGVAKGARGVQALAAAVLELARSRALRRRRCTED